MNRPFLTHHARVHSEYAAPVKPAPGKRYVSVSLRNFAAFMSRQWRWIMVLTLLVSGLGTVAGLFIPPIYAAKVLLEIDPSENDLLSAAGKMAQNDAFENSRIDGAVEILRSEAMLRTVIAGLNLLHDDEFGVRLTWLDRLYAWYSRQQVAMPVGDRAMRRVLDRLANAVVIERRNGTRFIQIMVRSTNAAKSALIANTIAQAHVRNQVNVKVANILEIREILQSRLDENNKKLSEIRRQMDDLVSKVFGYPDTVDLAIRIEHLGQQQEMMRNQVRILMQRIYDVEAQSELQVADSHIVAPALIPGTPVFPDMPVLAFLSFVAGLLVAFLSACVRDNVAKTFTSTAQVRAAMDIPSIIHVPAFKFRHARKRTGRVLGVTDAVSEMPRSVYSESVRRIQAEIDLSRRRPPRRVVHASTGSIIMFSSPEAGEGKSTLALSVARNSAMTGQRTLLIDADFRKPDIHRMLDLEPTAGLYEYLAENAAETALKDMISTEDESGLQVMPGAWQRHMPSDHVALSHKFSNLLHHARMQYDLVILDTSSLNPLVTGQYLARHADLIFFTLMWGRSARTLARDALDSLAHAKRPDTDIVAILNCSRTVHASRHAQMQRHVTDVH